MMKDLLLLFGVTLAKRYTNRQKRIFYSQVEPFFTQLGYTIKMQEVNKKWARVSNILIGDISKANRIFVCPYDTPSRAFLRFKYFPFTLSKNLRQENRELLLQILIYIISSILIFFSFRQYSVSSTLMKVFLVIFLSILVVFCYRLSVGFPNRMNFNRNSASVAMIAALAQKTKNNPKTAYVLLDKTVSSNTGWRLFVEDEGLKNKTIVYLDCIAYGEKLMCAYNSGANSEAKKIIASCSNLDLIDYALSEEQLQDTNLQAFSKMICLCAGEGEGQDLFVPDTRSKKDFRVDVPRLEGLRDGLLNYLKG